MGNKVPYTDELAARVVELHRQRVCIRVIVQLTNCSVAQAKRAISESPTRNADIAARIRHVASKSSVGERSQHGPNW
jgi:hypothetical protein